MSGGENYKYIQNIKSPDDLKAIPRENIDEVCEELRHCIINRVSENGGHLASNLGVVEMTVALHRIFDCPRDRVIFDVGHQSYVHKLLTGRYEKFDTLRKGGGISGFTKRSESEYDCFGAGHSSTSLSAAIGFATADMLSGSDAYTVAILGDGAFTGGMIHEALNNINKNLRLIIILNENEMSISRNIGRFARSLAKMRRKTGYFKAKRATASFLKKIPLVGGSIFRGVRGVKKFVKNAIYGSVYFEDMGLYYLGPADGNNYADVEALLKEAKMAGESVLIHLKTKKGKGYAPAETDPGIYHGLSCDNHCLEHGGKLDLPCESFSAYFGKTLTAMASEDEKICAITAAMSYGTGLDIFAETHKDRFFDVGIAEEHAVTFAAGLSAGGYKPAVAVYSTFLQRGYDQMIHDVALQDLPVVFCIDRAGLNPSDGATHHGIFDVAFMSEIPNMEIYAPVTYEGLKASLCAAFASGKASAVRYPSGCEKLDIKKAFYNDGYDGKIKVRTDFEQGMGLDALVVTHGRYASECLRAEKHLAAEDINVGVALCEYIRPYAKLSKEIREIIETEKPRLVIFAEEEIKAGGFGMMLSEELRKSGALDGIAWDIVAVDNDFVIQSKNESIYLSAGISAEDIKIKIYENLKKQARKLPML